MTRVIGGSLGGRRLSTPESDSTRPTSDRVREALFGSLSAARDLEGTRWLDLFAGSGAVGLEAASRGAQYVLSFESHAKTARVLRANIAALGLTGRVEVVSGSLPSRLAKPHETPGESAFDVAFADPPYSMDNATLHNTLTALIECGWLADDADVIVERSVRSGEPDWPDSVILDRSRRYGETILWYGHRSWT